MPFLSPVNSIFGHCPWDKPPNYKDSLLLRLSSLRFLSMFLLAGCLPSKIMLILYDMPGRWSPQLFFTARFMMAGLLRIMTTRAARLLRSFFGRGAKYAMDFYQYYMGASNSYVSCSHVTILHQRQHTTWVSCKIFALLLYAFT